mgnify:FL=1
MANDYLLKTWREIAYNQEQTQEQYNQFWGAYFVQEKEVYKDILGHPDVVVKGTVEELAKKYNMEGNLLAGANIAGFEKVAEAMLAQGVAY